MSIITVECDRCGVREITDDGTRSRHHSETHYATAREEVAAEHGWTFIHGEDLCPSYKGEPKYVV